MINSMHATTNTWNKTEVCLDFVTSALALAALLQRVGSPPADGMPMQKQLTHSPSSEEKNSSGSLHISHGGGDLRKHPDPEYPGCKREQTRDIVFFGNPPFCTLRKISMYDQYSANNPSDQTNGRANIP